MRGIVLSGIMVMILPMIWKPDTIWYSMIITEIIVAVYVVNKISSYKLGIKDKWEVMQYAGFSFLDNTVDCFSWAFTI